MTERVYCVQGHVQGVGFRWWTRSLALRLGLTGTVRNCMDGSVEVRVRGTEEAVAELRRSLAEGPPGARVDAIYEQPSSDVPTDRFEIVH